MNLKGQGLTDAQIAKLLIDRLPSGAFAHAARDAVVYNDLTTLQRMMPGVAFAYRKVNPTEWELVGTCADGSTVVWRVGG